MPDWDVVKTEALDPWAVVSHEPATGATGPAGPADKPLSWSDVGKQALSNIPSSAASTGRGMIEPVIHPVKTAQSLYHTAIGEAEKLTGEHGKDEAYATALNSYFTNRYGSIEGFKKALAKDPVGVATDVSALFTGGEMLPGKIGSIASKAAKATNIADLAAEGVAKVAKPVGKAAAQVVGGLGTHTGGQVLRKAAEAGYFGGSAAKAFLDNMRDKAPLEDAVDSAKKAVSQMRAERGAAYRSGMADVSKDKTVLDFTDIDKALTKANDIKVYKGVDIDPATSAIRKQLNDIVDDWKKRDPAEFHTPEGMDALKQMIGNVRSATPYGSPERVAADHVYHAVRDEIRNQAPGYAKVMRDYEDASDTIDQLQKAFSLKEKAAVDTSLRKLQSIMRDNVQTNYGYRTKLADKLVQHGANNLEYQLAGQASKSPLPRGFGGYEAGIPILASILTHGNLAPLAALPFMSPRLMGESAYYLGKGASAAPIVKDVTKAAPASYLLSQSPFAQ